MQNEGSAGCVEYLLIGVFFFVNPLFNENPDQLVVKPAIVGLLLQYSEGLYWIDTFWAKGVGPS